MANMAPLRSIVAGSVSYIIHLCIMLTVTSSKANYSCEFTMNLFLMNILMSCTKALVKVAPSVMQFA